MQYMALVHNRGDVVVPRATLARSWISEPSHSVLVLVYTSPITIFLSYLNQMLGCLESDSLKCLVVWFVHGLFSCWSNVHTMNWLSNCVNIIKHFRLS